MKTFLIDLENVKNQGFVGIDKLAAEDRVFVFYSDGANTLNIPTIQLINRSACSVEYVPLQRSGHNAMDFQIVGLLGFLIGSEKQGYFGIISQDQGYLAPVEFFMDHSADVLDIHVLVTPNILAAVRKWEAQAQNNRKVLTTGKKNENNRPQRNAAEVIDVEAVQSKTSEVLSEELEEPIAENIPAAEVVEEVSVVIPEETMETTDAAAPDADFAEPVQEAEPVEEHAETVMETAEENAASEDGTEAAAGPVQTAEKIETEEPKMEENASEEAAAEVKPADPIGVYTEEISNAFVGAIVDSADTAADENEVPAAAEKKNSRTSRSKKKKPAKKNPEKSVDKSAENAGKIEPVNEKISKEEKAESAEKKESSKSEKKQETVKAEKKERTEKKKESRKNSKKSLDINVDPQAIQVVHNLIGEKLDEEQVQLESEIVKAVLATEGKNHFYQYFNHTLGREKGGNLYHAIRNDYEKLVKALKA